MNYYATTRSDAMMDSRASFIMKTYMHVFGAMLLFVFFQIVIFATGFAIPLYNVMMSVGWYLPLGLFMVAGWIARSVAHKAQSLPSQYMALIGFVAAQAIIFVPLLVIASLIAPGVIFRAGLITLLGTTGLTMIAFYTRKDFSFMRSILMWGGLCAMMLIGASFIFGLDLGTWFSVGMIALAGGGILYDTSNVIHHYTEDRYVAASLELFASMALMFWYVLQLLLSMSGRD